VWQDPFTTLFDPETAISIADCLVALGYQPVFIKLLPGGKAAHVLGDRSRFLRQAKRLHGAIGEVAASGRPMIGVDAAFVMMLRQEYAKSGLGEARVLLVQEMLSREIASGRTFPQVSADRLPKKLFL
ncbi:FAD-binding oxidoreductase, partial [Ensifer sp. P24N7]